MVPHWGSRSATLIGFPTISDLLKHWCWQSCGMADTLHLIGTTHLFWTFFVSCHRSDSWSCDHHLPWGGLIMTYLNCLISVTVQCFYCRRIWTISGKNKPLTLAVFVLAMLQLGSGTWYNIDVARVGTIQYLFQCPLILPISISGTLCDIVITLSIFKYMWRSGFRRERTIIQDLAVVCLNMGAFTCITSFITGIMFLVQGDGYWVASVGMVISQSYVNSMLAVLNARRVIRDRDVNVYELSSI
ncbi:hypothetical protein V8E55_005563 [Tylopilus felleus]